MAMLLCAITLVSFCACQPNEPNSPSESDSESVSVSESESNPDLPENVLQVAWHYGAIGSKNNTSSPCEIYEKEFFSYSDVIEIPKKGTKITFTDDNLNSNGDNRGFIFYDDFFVSSWKKNESGEWVFNVMGGNVEGPGTSDYTYSKWDYDPETSIQTMTYSYVTSLDNECIRLCFRSGQTASFTPEVFPTVTFEYTDEPGTDLEDINNARFLERNNFPELKGIKFNIIGDSYVAPSSAIDKWPDTLADKYKMIYSNKGISGSQMSNHGTRNPMVIRYTDMPDNNPDIVILQGGRNDYNDKVPMGDNDSTDTKTFKGAVNFLITKLQEKYPNALILTITAWNVAKQNTLGYSTADYGKALAEVSALRGIPCFHAYDQEISGVNMNDKAFRTKYCTDSSDVSHLNQDGHNYFFPVIEKFIGEEYQKFLAAKAN